MKAILIGLAAGLLFGTGLVLARATDPAVVLGFLDVTGAWNPALIGLMGAGATTFGLLYWIARRRGRIVGALLTQELSGSAAAVWAPEVTSTWRRGPSKIAPSFSAHSSHSNTITDFSGNERVR